MTGTASGPVAITACTAVSWPPLAASCQPPSIGSARPMRVPSRSRIGAA